MTRISAMTLEEELQLQIATQERIIYQLRAEKAEAERDVARLRRVNDRNVRELAKLQAKLDPKTQAEAAFKK
jgi:uncharacterized coiled-coil protein SlyX